MTKDKLFHSKYAYELLEIAKGDLASAEVLASQSSKGRKENICFTAQQSIEKVLKAVLCAHGKPVPLTHNIELLLDRLAADQPPDGERLIELTDFATIRSYQEGSEILTQDDLDATIAAAQATYSWGQDLIAKVLAKGP